MIPSAGRMVLLQLAHPAVAQAIVDFDRFREDPTRRARLTAVAMRKLISGSKADAETVAQRLAAVHASVSGPGYSARDPELVLWIHATFFDSLLLFYEHAHGVLTRGTLEELHEQVVVVGEMLGCPRAHQPESIREFRAYVADMACHLQVSLAARELADVIFWPSSSALRAPIMSAYRVISYGTLHPRLRQQFGYRWTPFHGSVLRAGATASPVLCSVVKAYAWLLGDGNARGATTLMSVAGFPTSGAPRPRHARGLPDR